MILNPPTGDVVLLDTTHRTLRPSPVPQGRGDWAVFSGDGSALATAASSGEIEIRDGPRSRCSAGWA